MPVPSKTIIEIMHACNIERGFSECFCVCSVFVLLAPYTLHQGSVWVLHTWVLFCSLCSSSVRVCVSTTTAAYRCGTKLN